MVGYVRTCAVAWWSRRGVDGCPGPRRAAAWGLVVAVACQTSGLPGTGTHAAFCQVDVFRGTAFLAHSDSGVFHGWQVQACEQTCRPRTFSLETETVAATQCEIGTETTTTSCTPGTAGTGVCVTDCDGYPQTAVEEIPALDPGAEECEDCEPYTTAHGRWIVLEEPTMCDAGTRYQPLNCLNGNQGGSCSWACPECVTDLGTGAMQCDIGGRERPIAATDPDNCLCDDSCPVDPDPVACVPRTVVFGDWLETRPPTMCVSGVETRLLSCTDGVQGDAGDCNWSCRGLRPSESRTCASAAHLCPTDPENCLCDDSCDDPGGTDGGTTDSGSSDGGSSDGGSSDGGSSDSGSSDGGSSDGGATTGGSTDGGSGSGSSGSSGGSGGTEGGKGHCTAQGNHYPGDEVYCSPIGRVLTNGRCEQRACPANSTDNGSGVCVCDPGYVYDNSQPGSHGKTYDYRRTCIERTIELCGTVADPGTCGAGGTWNSGTATCGCDEGYELSASCIPTRLRCSTVCRSGSSTPRRAT